MRAIDQLQEASRARATDLVAQQEKYLELLMAQLGITVQEFVRDYIIEEYPVEWMVDDNALGDSVTIKVRQSMRIRRKTDAELAVVLGDTEKENEATD